MQPTKVLVECREGVEAEHAVPRISVEDDAALNARI